MEDKLEMAKERVGLGTWENILTDAEKEKLVNMEIWKKDVYEKWIVQFEEEQMKKMKGGSSKGSKKKNKKRQDDDDDEGEYIE